MTAHPLLPPLSNSPIGWMGGKHKLRTTLINIMPPHFGYVEAFAGSATILFAKQPTPLQVINDLDSGLIVFFRLLAGAYGAAAQDQFIRYVRSMPPSREAYEDWSKWPQARLDALSPPQKAFVFYYCVKNSFSSIPGCGYSASPYGPSRYNMMTDFTPYMERLTGVVVEALDFRSLVTKYNVPRGDILFLMDPPYWVANKTQYYKHVFGPADHTDLRACCDAIHNNGNRFVVTYDDVREVITHYADYCIYRTDPLVYSASDASASSRPRKRELVITNYDVVEALREAKRDSLVLGDRAGQQVVIPGYPGLTRISVPRRC